MNLLNLYFFQSNYWFNFYFKVPPRIRDDTNDANSGSSNKDRVYKEGDQIKFSCFATGTPKPNISWFAINDTSQSLINLNQNDNYLIIDNITRNTPKNFQCRASNGLPPNDRRNFTYRLSCKCLRLININGNFIFINKLIYFSSCT